MMEKVVLPPQRPRLTDEEVRKRCPWAATGRTPGRARNVITSLELDSAKMEENNLRFQATYKKIEENEVRFDEYAVDDCDYLIVAYGSIARISQKAVEWHARKESKSESSVQSRCGLSRMQRLSVWQNAQKAY